VKGRDHLVDRRLCEDNIIMDSKKQCMRMWTVFIGHITVQLQGFLNMVTDIGVP